MSPSLRPARRFLDMVENIDRIALYIGDLSAEDYGTDQKTQDAVERCLLRISEAATKLGTDAEETFPAHDWAGMRGMGNVLRHGYDTIDPDVIWRVVTIDLPPLRRDLAAVLTSSAPGFHND